MGFEALDPAILKALPSSGEVVSVVRHGTTSWSRGLRVDVMKVDGDASSFFIKLIEKQECVGMAEAEYEGQKAIAAIIPESAMKPFAWGYYENDKTRSWFLTQFRHLLSDPPQLRDLLTVVKRLHHQSVSPTGKFGFHVTPYYGQPPMVVDWTDNWEEFWIRMFRSDLEYAQQMRGHDPELVEVAEEFIDKVVPRLLRPLQTGGRSIKPSLCHGDLWDGNIQTDRDSLQPALFDPCPFYGHHEMDLQCMRSPRYVVGIEFANLYRNEVGASEPVDDFDDRNALYAIRNEILTAVMRSRWACLIDKAKEEMRRLVHKHPDGLAGFKGDDPNPEQEPPQF